MQGTVSPQSGVRGRAVGIGSASARLQQRDNCWGVGALNLADPSVWLGEVGNNCYLRALKT